MTRFTGWHLHYLKQIVDLVRELCGEDGSEVGCTCLDEDDEAEHDPLCAWNNVWPVLDILASMPGYMPDKAVEVFAEVRGMLEESGEALDKRAQQMRDAPEADNVLRSNQAKACVKCGGAVTCDAFETEPTCINCRDDEEQSK